MPSGESRDRTEHKGTGPRAYESYARNRRGPRCNPAVPCLPMTRFSGTGKGEHWEERSALWRTMTPDRLRGSAHAVVNEPERRAVRIGYEMQFALVESVPSSFLTDINEADIGEWTCRKERFNPTA